MFGIMPDWFIELGSDFEKTWHIWAMLGGFLGAIGAALKWTTPKIFKSLIDDAVEPIKEQFKNNGGSTIKDSLDKIHDTQQELQNTLLDTQSIIAQVQNRQLVMQDKQSQLNNTLEDHTASDAENFKQIMETIEGNREIIIKTAESRES